MSYVSAFTLEQFGCILLFRSLRFTVSLAGARRRGEDDRARAGDQECRQTGPEETSGRGGSFFL